MPKRAIMIFVIPAPGGYLDAAIGKTPYGQAFTRSHTPEVLINTSLTV